MKRASLGAILTVGALVFAALGAAAPAAAQTAITLGLLTSMTGPAAFVWPRLIPAGGPRSRGRPTPSGIRLGQGGRRAGIRQERGEVSATCQSRCC